MLWLLRLVGACGVFRLLLLRLPLLEVVLGFAVPRFELLRVVGVVGQWRFNGVYRGCQIDGFGACHVVHVVNVNCVYIGVIGVGGIGVSVTAAHNGLQWRCFVVLSSERHIARFGRHTVVH